MHIPVGKFIKGREKEMLNVIFRNDWKFELPLFSECVLGEGNIHHKRRAVWL